MGYPQIVITGDSIAQLSFKAGGYGAWLTDELNGRADVVNRGFGGYNSRQLLKCLKDGLDMCQKDVRLFIIHIGTNDSAIGSFQTVPLAEYRSNLKSIISHIRSEYEAEIILLTPSTLNPPVLEAIEASLGLPKELLHPRTPENTTLYVKACLEVGASLDVPVIDCFALHEEALKKDTMDDLFPDGLHFSPKGYSYVNNALQPMIESLSLVPPTLPYAFPDFFIYGREEDPQARKVAPIYVKVREEAEKREAAKKLATLVAVEV